MAFEVSFSPLPVDQTDVSYAHGPDSSVHDDVPAGSITTFEWNDSTIYPGTSRGFRVYVPHQYDAASPASLVVAQDGSDFVDPDDEMRTAVVLDNLIHQGDLPITIGVFVDAGSRDPADRDGPPQRNVEYDAADDRYATFLVDEVLPEVTRRWSVTDDPARRCIVGFSSGGNAAFTAAWHRPDVFGRVVGFSSSFAQMPGGDPYPAVVASSPTRSLRIFLQVGHRDLGWNEPEGNWFAENLRVAAALAEASYDVRLVVGRRRA